MKKKIKKVKVVKNEKLVLDKDFQMYLDWLWQESHKKIHCPYSRW